MIASDFIVLLLCAVLGTIAVYRIWNKNNSRLPLPPSPRSYPIIGHLLSVPTQDEHLGYLEIGKQLNSDIFSLSVLGTNIVVLNSLKHATDLLEKRSAIYSDRASPPMVSEPSLMNWGSFVSLQGYTDRWRMYRRLMHPWLNKKAIEIFSSAQQLAARSLLQRLLKFSVNLNDSEELHKELHMSVASSIANSVYGHQIKSLNDPFLIEVRELMENFSRAVMPSNFWVNLFPAMVYLPSWLPGTGWKLVGRKWGEQKDCFVNTAYAQSKTRIAAGEDHGSFVSSLLGQEELLKLEESEADEHVKQLAVTIVGGGTDTTAASLLIFILAMLLFPEVQKRAQQEIDAVIGPDRLPTMEDKPNLGYVNRLVEEVLRWRPTGPIGLSHASYQDDVYQGYRIPKGTIIVSNIWAMNHDQNIYKNPEIFDPDRYIDSSVPLPSTFGFGRRLCPGLHFAKTSMFISIASILAMFDVGCPKDAEGNVIMPVEESTNQLFYHPKAFGLSLEPRSSTRAMLIRAEELE